MCLCTGEKQPVGVALAVAWWVLMMLMCPGLTRLQSRDSFSPPTIALETWTPSPESLSWSASEPHRRVSCPGLP